MSTNTWVNAGDGKCLSAPQSDGGSMITVPCDPNNSRQQITFKGDGQGIQTVARSNNDGIVNTWNGNVYWSAQCGKGNDCAFHVQSINAQEPFPNGLFKWYGWGRQGGYDASVQNGNVTQNAAQDGTPAAMWLPYNIAQDCNQYGIPLSQCTASNRSDCSKYNNKLRAQCYASSCPTNDGSELGRSECKDYCRNNPGKCDVAVSNYCTKNPGDTDFCGCYNYDKSNPNNNAVVTQMLTMPQCYLQQCAGGVNAYKTAAYVNTTVCPSLTICSADLSQTSGGSSSMKGVTVTQNCGDSGSKGASSSTTTSNQTSNQPSTATQNTALTSLTNNTTALYGGIGAIICCCLLMMLVLIM